MTSTHRSLVIGILIALACSSFGQLGAPGARANVAIMPEVQREIGLSKQQRKAITDAMAGMSRQSQMDPMSAMSGGGTGDMVSNMNEKLDAEALSTLDEGQKKRLEELWSQYEGPSIWSLKPIADKLSLTDDQRSKAADIIAKANDALMAKLQHAPRGMGSGRGFNRDLEKMAKQKNDDLVALLTPDQSKVWSDMLGKPFKFKTPKMM